MSMKEEVCVYSMCGRDMPGTFSNRDKRILSKSPWLAQWVRPRGHEDTLGIESVLPSRNRLMMPANSVQGIDLDYTYSG